MGDQSRSFYIYKGVLCYFSDYFKAALCGEFTEANSDSVTLDENNPHIFGFVFRWLFTGKLACADGNEEPLSQLELCLIWIFADQKIMPQLQNDSIDELYSAISKEKVISNHEELLHAVYAGSTEGSAIRRMIVEGLVRVGDFSALTYVTRDSWPDELLVDLVKRLSSAMSRNGEMVENVVTKWGAMRCCNFHDHTRSGKGTDAIKPDLPVKDDDPSDLSGVECRELGSFGKDDPWHTGGAGSSKKGKKKSSKSASRWAFEEDEPLPFL